MHTIVEANFQKKEYIPGYSGKQIVNGERLIFSSNRSFLFKNKIILVSVNHLLLQIESNNFNDSCIRFCKKKIKKNENNKLANILLIHY